MKRLLFISNLFPDRASPVRGLDNAVLLRHLADGGREQRPDVGLCGLERFAVGDGIGEFGIDIGHGGKCWD